MSGDDGWMAWRQFSHGDVEVGVTDAAGEDFEERLIFCGRGDGKLFDAERIKVYGLRRSEDCSAHGIGIHRAFLL
jgi:hypothetical protein